ncbi:cytochrome P450 [Sphingopyxis sp. R3-92]|uniref:cytochrome P450 n=1 Tax=Sphingopyxis sp. R3-92 TaxID=3158553 RepID=UPI003EE4E234
MNAPAKIAFSEARFGPETGHWLPLNPESALDHIPGEDGYPVIGNTLEQLGDYPAFSRRMVAKYGHVFRNHSMGGRSVGMYGPDANELVMFDRDKIFSSEQGWGPVLNLLFPRGLMLMDFEKHRADRKVLSVAFKPEPMRHYAESLNAGIKDRVASWSGKTFKFYPAIKKLTLDLAATSFLGIPFGPEADKVNKAFVDMVQASIGIVRVPLPFTAMGRGAKGRAYLVEYFSRMVPERREGEGEDIFSQICRARDENGEYLSVGAIVDHMNFLMMAAHDTITSSVTTLVWQLAKHPEWQDKLREEMLAVAPAGEGVGHNSLGELELTEWAFKEALRLVPPVPSFPRRALKDFEFGGYRIPAGTIVGVSPGFTHMMEEHWPEPETFDPMRFSPEVARTRHKYAWVPFGGGAHMCLGLHFAYMQAKIFFHHVITTHRIVVAEGYDPKWLILPIPRPKDGLTVSFVPLAGK